MKYSPHNILVLVAIFLAAISYLGVPTVGVSVIVLGVAVLVPQTP